MLDREEILCIKVNIPMLCNMIKMEGKLTNKPFRIAKSLNNIFQFSMELKLVFCEFIKL